MFKDTQQQIAHVKKVEGTLVIALSDVAEPTVWRLNLNDMVQTRFSLKALESGQCSLMLLEDGKGEKVLGIFQNEQRAKTVLDMIQNTLEQKNVNECKQSIGFLKYLVGLILIIAILAGGLILVPALFHFDGVEQASQIEIQMPSETSHKPSNTLDIETGVPVDADAFFQQFETGR